MARAREEESELNNATGQKTSPPRVASTVDDDGDVLAARPTPLAEVRPQERVQRHTAVRIVDILPYVQILDVPVPQMGNQVVEVLRKIDTPLLVEQVIEVPKILLDELPARTSVRVTQLAEQVVEVPTTVSNSSLQRTMEHHVDIPVPGREGRASGLPGQGSTALQNRIAELIVERFGEFSGGGLQDFRPGQSSSSSSHRHSRSELPPHSSPWTLAAYDASMVLEEEEDDEPAIEYVECDRLWWGCEWVPARQQYCWWLAAADVSQVGHTIWRPPWLIGSR